MFTFGRKHENLQFGRLRVLTPYLVKTTASEYSFMAKMESPISLIGTKGINIVLPSIPVN